MQITTTVTQKGQVTLPKELRLLAEIFPYDRVSVDIDKKVIKIKKTKTLLDISPLTAVSAEKSALMARKFMENHYERD